ncbi:hypothetical protein IFR05_004346 [Cadophora sp. M221]|nr:hypothetical protein IFR05_004346 [Cadophora sp. M221]
MIDQNMTVRENGNVKSVVWATKTTERGKRYLNATGILFQRRSDLGEIQLTCENAKTPVPYIDLVLEVLEEFIKSLPSFNSFTIPASAPLLSALNGRTLSVVKGLIDSRLPRVLSEYATIDVVEPGKYWVIDELGFSYFLNGETGGVHFTRGKQTRGPPADLAARPQYVNASAYELLQTSYCPNSLPFDLWSETARAYLAHVNVRRNEVMETFSELGRAQALAEPAIAYEHLGLTDMEARIVRGATDVDGNRFLPWQMLGLLQEDLATSAIPDPSDRFKMIDEGVWSDIITSRVDIFLQQSRLSYREFLNCMEIGRVLGATAKMSIDAHEGADVDTCDLSLLRIQNMTPVCLVNLVRLIRLQRRLEGWRIFELARAFGLAPMPSDAAALEQVLVRISAAKRLTELLGLPVDDVLSFWRPLETTGFIDHNDDDDYQAGPRSQYDKIFRNETITSQQGQAFPKDAASLSGELADGAPTITASLNISVFEFNLLTKNRDVVSGDELNLENLSRLLPHVTLLRALEISVKDHLTILSLMESGPCLEPFGTVLFVERVRKLVTASLSLSQTDYLLRSRVSPDEDVSMSDDSISTILADVRESLQQVAREQTFSEEIEDTKGDITKQKLSLLNFDPDVVARIVGVVTDTATYQIELHSQVGRILAIPESLRDTLTYDDATRTLTFSRIMSQAERDQLKNTANAIANLPLELLKVLTDAIDNFLRSPEVTIAKTLAKKVYWDSEAKKIYSLGSLTISEVQRLITGVTDTTFVDAVKSLSQAPITQRIDAADQFLNDTDITNLLDRQNGATVARKFDRVLQKLIPYLFEQLSNQVVKQKLGQALNLTTQILDALLSRHLIVSGMIAAAVVRDSTYTLSNKSIPVSQTRFPAQFAAFRILEKIYLLVNKLNIGLVELNWLFSLRKSSPTDPTRQWLDLQSLPVEYKETNVADFTGWERLLAVMRLRDDVPKGRGLLDDIWKTTRGAIPDITTTLARIVKSTSWDVDELKRLVGPEGFKLSFPTDFRDERALLRLVTAMKLTCKIGCTVTDAFLLSGVNVTETGSNAIRRAVKSKYDQQTWNTVARPLHNIFREKQREALVAYLLARPNRGAKTTWHTSNDLYAYFLVDVEQGPCAFTSRLKQAIGSVQTLTQRCLLNLELEVEANSEVDDGWEEWNLYLKSVLLTGANRQILCYPENYLESAFRDDKSPPYKDFEQKLLQSPVTKENAEIALMSYLDELDVVSHLHVLSYCQQYESFDGENTGIDTLHVFARTRSVPWRYFNAKRLDGSRWTPWEKLNIEIQGEHLIPFIWNRRLHLFWAIFSERKVAQSSIIMPQPGKSVNSKPGFVDVQLAWSTFRAGNWTSKQITGEKISLSRAKAPYYGPPLEKALVITCLHKTKKPVPQGQFVFRNVKGMVETIIFKSGTVKFDGVLSKNSREFAMTYKIRHSTGSPRPLSPVWLPNPVNSPSNADIAILGNSPGEDHTLVFAPEWPYPRIKSVFFFQHDEKTCVVTLTPGISFQPIRYLLGDVHKLHPGVFEGVSIGRYLAQTAAPIFKQPLPRPLAAGPSAFRPSGEIYHEPVPDIGNLEAESVGSILGGALGNTETNLAMNLASTRFSDRPLSFEPAIAEKLDVLRTLQPDLLPTGSYRINPDIRTTLISLHNIKFNDTYKFSSFYHPFVEDFMMHLNRDGVDGLYQRPLQLLSRDSFNDTYKPDPLFVDPDHPTEVVSFIQDNLHSTYNWELFFHIPMTIASQLSANQQFRDAQKWYHYVFDPTDTTSLPSPQRFWQMGRFFQTSSKTYTDENLPNMLLYLAKGGSGVKLSAYEQKLVDYLNKTTHLWRNNPFNSFLIARSRTIAFQKWVVMKYLDNLVAWGDNLFRQDSIEAINEATQIYILARGILGPRPEEIPRRAIPKVQTFNSIAESLDGLSNSLAQVEEFVSVRPFVKKFTIRPAHQPNVASATIMYFCAPMNSKLRSYWDKVEDMLGKIRKCMNLQGIVRELALFEAPLDPAMLVQAAAAGVDLSSIMSETNAPLSQYRFSTLMVRAVELVGLVKEFGRLSIDALEKKDASVMALLLSDNEISLLRRSQMNPDAKLGAPTSIGITIGGPAVARSSTKFGKFMEKLSVATQHDSQMSSEMGSFYQRKDGWDLEADVAQKEIDQISVQLQGADIKREITKKELLNHKKQIDNSKGVNRLMRSKFTNTELYEWSISQLSSEYFQAYRLAYDAAKRAQHFAKSLKKGLLAGKQLHRDLLRLQSAYMEKNKREYEINQNISLSQIDLIALLQLQTTGECFFGFSEAVFDLSYPSHYMRRLKSVGVTVPCVVGPYTSVAATLSLLKSSTRISAWAEKSYTRRENDPRFRDNFEQTDSICTSNGISDHGLFELNLRGDDRYLPFEYARAISSWRLKLPDKFRQFDYSTISDVVFHVRYTSQEAGEAVRAIIESELQLRILEAVQMAEGQTGMARLLQLRRDFPDQFYRLTAPVRQNTETETPQPQEMTIPVTRAHLPHLLVAAKSITFKQAAVFVKVASKFQDTEVTAETLRLTVRAKGAEVKNGIATAPWNGYLRAGFGIKEPWGELILGVSLEGDGRLPHGSIEDIMVVLYYSTSW